jgi:hypothetical protein
MLIDYFALERSLGSMDITAYRSMGGRIHLAKAGDTLPDGTVVVGKKLGGQSYYVCDDDWESVTGSTAERREAWGWLDYHATNHADWTTCAMMDWAADNGFDPPKMAEYFGISEKAAEKAVSMPLDILNADRAKAWGVWK